MVGRLSRRLFNGRHCTGDHDARDESAAAFRALRFRGYAVELVTALRGMGYQPMVSAEKARAGRPCHMKRPTLHGVSRDAQQPERGCG
jgi:hypothetical protein